MTKSETRSKVTSACGMLQFGGLLRRCMCVELEEEAVLRM